jgi:hypothetical protein
MRIWPNPQMPAKVQLAALLSGVGPLGVIDTQIAF